MRKRREREKVMKEGRKIMRRETEKEEEARERREWERNVRVRKRGKENIGK